MADELPNLLTQVEWVIDASAVDKLKAMARELDEQRDEVTEYSLPQALQIVWHNDPMWVHTNLLYGWVLSDWKDEGGHWRHVWGPDAERPLDRSPEAVEKFLAD